MSGAACAKVILCGWQLGQRTASATDRLADIYRAIDEYKDNPTYMPMTDASLAAVIAGLETAEDAMAKVEKGLKAAEAALVSGIGYAA